MAEAGKHIWIEKPVGTTAEDARAVSDAVTKAGVQGTVGFNYRGAPAVAAARELIASGEIGTVTHVRIRLFSDYAAHPEGALRPGATSGSAAAAASSATWPRTASTWRASCSARSRR